MIHEIQNAEMVLVAFGTYRVRASIKMYPGIPTTIKTMGGKI